MATDVTATNVTAAPDAATPATPVTPAPEPAVPATPDVTAPVAGGAAGTAPVGPPKPVPMSFAEGVSRANPSYTTDAQGNVIRSEPARSPSVKGTLGGVLMGALQGAARGAAAQAPEGARGKGAAFSAGAAASEKGKIAADNRARAIAQQNFENTQKSAENRARQSLMNAQAVDLMQRTEHENAKFPAEMEELATRNEEARQRIETTNLQLTNLKEAQQENYANLLSFAQAQRIPGVELVTRANTGGKEGDDLGTVYKGLMPLAPDIAGGKVALTHTGQKGPGNGIGVIHLDDWKSVPLPADYHYKTYDGTMNPNGTPHSTDAVVSVKDAQGRPTGASMFDAYIASKGAVGQLAQVQGQITSNMQNEHLKAQAGELRAKAESERAAAEMTRKQMTGNVPPTGWQIPADALTKGPQALSADIQKAGGVVPTNFNQLYAVAQYMGDLDTFPTTPRPKTGQISRSDAANAIRTLIDPHFNETEFPTIKKYMAEFGGSKSGEGATRDRMNTAISHLALMRPAAEAMANDTGSHQLQVLNSLANAYGLQTGHDPIVIYNAIASKAAGELAGAIKGGSGSATDQEIDKALKLFDPKMTPSQQLANLRTQAQLLKGAEDTIAGHFKDTTHHTPEELGHHVLFSGNKEKLDGLLGIGGGGQPQSKVFTNKAGQTFPLDANNQFTSGGWIYQSAPDGTGATPLHPVTGK